MARASAEAKGGHFRVQELLSRAGRRVPVVRGRWPRAEGSGAASRVQSWEVTQKPRPFHRG